jgi:hypothetical protein
MEHPYPSAEFEVEVDEEGRIRLPRRLRSRIAAGSRLTIRLTEGVVGESLRARNITEEEIELIARRQLEDRDQIVEFLQSEGALSGNRRFAVRAKKLVDG